MKGPIANTTAGRWLVFMQTRNIEFTLNFPIYPLLYLLFVIMCAYKMNFFAASRSIRHTDSRHVCCPYEEDVCLSLKGQCSLFLLSSV